MIRITKLNVDALLDSGKLYCAMRNGKWWQMRRNGKTIRWVKDTSRIAIPFKAGFKVYGKLTETDFRPDFTPFGNSEASGDYLNPEHFRHVDDVLPKGK